MSAAALPVIGLTPDIEASPAGATETEYRVRANYADAFARAGGLPVVLPYGPAFVDAYADLVDGLVVTGGMFDIHPARYGAKPRGDVVTKDNRTDFEQAMLRVALDRDIPVLGICNGMQLLAITLGGGLIQHIPSEVPDALRHMARETPFSPEHDVAIVPGTFLHQTSGLDVVRVNSVHHQSVLEGIGYRIAARAADGVVEAIEVPERSFCLGLQWHPEYGTSSADEAILSAFIQAAARHRAKRS